MRPHAWPRTDCQETLQGQPGSQEVRGGEGEDTTVSVYYYYVPHHHDTTVLTIKVLPGHQIDIDSFMINRALLSIIFILS